MKTGNFPRVMITNGGLHFEPGENDWLISITDKGGDDARTRYEFGKVLYQKFNDTTKVGQGEITDDQAREIAAFIQEGRSLEKNIWVNCHAGICRSGAVTSVLIDLGFETSPHLGCPGRIPNWLVYDKVRKHFPELRNSWEDDSISTIWTPEKR